MTEGKKRKVHSAEFKAKLALEDVRNEMTINEIAQLKIQRDWLKKSPGYEHGDQNGLD